MSKRELLRDLECRWKWEYLCRKEADGATLTPYESWDEIEVALKELSSLAREPAQVDAWIAKHLSPKLKQTLQQTIRARRKRFFDARQQATQKKSITLQYASWIELSRYAYKHQLTLSEAVLKLLKQATFEQDAVRDALKALAKEMEIYCSEKT